MKRCLLLIPTFFFFITVAAQKFENLALTPPMGWNSWNTFQTNISEKLVMKTVDAIIASGMKEVGYQYIVLDDGWMTKQRDTNGNLVPDPKKFPHGMKALINYVHSKGLKFGLYNCAGTKTCAGYPGTRGYEYQDARFYARLGIDYLKYDWCSYGVFAKDNSEEELMKPYTLMGKALKEQSRDIIFSLCQYGMGDVWKWGYKTGGQLWRTGDDVRDNWPSVYAAFKKLADKSEYVQPGRWNDPDILQIGAVGAESREGNSNHLTKEEQRTVMSMWCLLSAPLFIGANLAHIDPFTLSLLTNNEVIAVDQDALGKAANLKLTLDNKVEVWTKELHDCRTAIGLLNPADTELSFDFAFYTIDKNGYYSVRNLWGKKNLGIHLKSLPCKIPSHGILLITLKTGTN